MNDNPKKKNKQNPVDNLPQNDTPTPLKDSTTMNFDTRVLKFLVLLILMEGAVANVRTLHREGAIFVYG